MMRQLRIPIRAVFYREDGLWVAHCLEFDVMGQGDTQKDALVSLSGAITTQVIASVEFGNPDNLFSPADSKLHQMFACGKDVAEGEFQIRFKQDNVQIENMTARVYEDEQEEGCGLQPAYA